MVEADTVAKPRAKEDTAIDPKPIISLMFAISVGFWASQLATYVAPTSENAHLRSDAKELQSWINNKLQKYVIGVDEKLQETSTDFRVQVSNLLEKHVTDPNGITRLTGKNLQLEIGKALEQQVLEDSDAKKLQAQINRKLEGYITIINPTNRRWQRWLTLGSGVLFLIDLLCIVWWYARYIYRVQPRALFRTYFLDFIICSMFALAANSWTKPGTFLFATLCASGFLIFRFLLLYFGSSASQTDRYILKIAGIALVLSVPIVVLSLMGVDKFLQYRKTEIYICGPTLPGLLSLIGIVLTVCLKTKIDVAVAIYLARHVLISPAYLAWPVPKSEEENEQLQQQHDRIRHRVKTGLEDFNNLFHQFRKHDRIYSRVHSATELRVQSYILALPSCEEESYVQEIEDKSFMVGVSHWLDDLVDGRNELFIYKRLQKYKSLQHDPPLSDEIEHAKKLFTQIYRPLIVKYTDPNFYERLYDEICDCCSLSFNRKYMFLGLNRVACGAAIFSPKLTHAQRMRILADHNDFIKVWNVEEKGDFENEVEKLIDKIAVGNEAGPLLLGLTTKTVQEIALSSEKSELNIGLSILLSILYAPLIYYHDIVQELENDEMIPLQAFDTDSDLWIPWLRNTCEILNKFKDEDERHTMRIKQIEMAYRCFKPMLPEHIKAELEKIYLGFPWDSKRRENKKQQTKNKNEKINSEEG